MARTQYRYKYDLLIGWGFLSWEAREFARQYSVAQIRRLPYLKAMTRWRRLYVSNLRSRGYSDKEIINRIYALYDTRDWLTDVGRLDPWKLLKRFRKQAIDTGEYPIPKRKGSHHKGGISKGDLQSQRGRRKQRLSELERYDIGRGR